MLDVTEDRAFILTSIPGGTMQSPISEEAQRDLELMNEEGLISDEDLRDYKDGLKTSDDIWDEVDKKIEDLLDEIFGEEDE